MGDPNYKQQSRASEAQNAARVTLHRLFDDSSLPRADLFGELDRASVTIKSGGYATKPGYRAHLEALLACHESKNIMSQVKKYELVEVDAIDTVLRYLTNHPKTMARRPTKFFGRSFCPTVPT